MSNLINKARVKYLLDLTGYNQADIADALGVSATAVGLTVSGKTRSPHIRKALSVVTGRPVSDLWPDETAKQQEE